jgi:peptidoglycan/LPS O-acetylase OafA/YrhL
MTSQGRTLSGSPTITRAELGMSSAESSTRALTDAHVSSLDGVRGLAILAVVLFHCSRILPPTGSPLAIGIGQVLTMGWTGVDLFFVLSGFLITGILLDARGDADEIPEHYFRSFWARRALRIFPLYFAYLLFALVLSPGKAMTPASDWWHWLYASNVLFSAWPNSMIAGRTSHLWSLAVEEQFYLLWPLVIAFMPRNRVLAISILLVITCPLVRLVCIALGGNNAAYEMMPARADTLAVGAILAILLRTPGGVEQLQRLTPRFAIPSALMIGALFLTYHGLPGGTPVIQVMGYTALALAYGAIVWSALNAPRTSRLRRVLASRPLRIAGKYSYCMYLVNSVLIRPIAEHAFPGASTLPLLSFLSYSVLVLTSTVVVAVISWHFYEKHFLHLKRFFPMPRPASRIGARSDAPVGTVLIPSV